MEENKKITWVADEYKAHDRDFGWYFWLFFFSAILIIWALYTNNLITTVLFTVILIVVYFLSHHEPGKMLVEISDKGVKLNTVFYPYKNLKYFWMLHHEDHTPILTFETKSFLNRHISMDLEDEEPDEIRSILAPHLEEIKDYEENFMDFLIRKLKI